MELEAANSYATKQHSLMQFIQESKEFLTEFKNWNKSRCTLHYPRSSNSFHILKLFIKSHNFKDSQLLVNLEENSISKLLDNKFVETMNHLDRLFFRLADTTSKILVTGDLNAGKSTFINSLLQVELLPSDQQPCTMSFCEIIDASKNNESEQVHAIQDLSKYSKQDPKTFEVQTFDQLKDTVTDDQSEKWFKLYCKNTRQDGISLLHNDVVDITLIDAPGLNSDSIKTMSVFAKQEDIDVIVFVINAANHLTLSAREFMLTAGKEKALMFIVVNKFDDIRNKEKCKRMILSQIKEVLPFTFDQSTELIHFISAKDHLDKFVNGNFDSLDIDFLNMEKSLTRFTLEKRILSKLQPVKTFIQNLLEDLKLLAECNYEQSNSKLQVVLQELEQSNPIYEKMSRIQDKFNTDLQKSLDSSCESIKLYSEKSLLDFQDNLEYQIDEVSWPGLVNCFRYINDVYAHVEYRTELQIKAIRHFAVDSTISGIHNMYSMAACNVWEVFNKTPDVKHFSQNIEFPKIEKLQLNIPKWELFTLSWKFNSTGWTSFLGVLGIVSGTVIGYSRIVGIAWKVVKYIPFLNFKSTLLVAAVALSGGVVMTLMDLQTIIQKNLKDKLVAHFEKTKWIESETEACVATARRTLKIPVWDLQKQYHQALHEQEQIRFEKERSKVIAEESLLFFKERKEKIEDMKSRLEEIEL